MIGESWRNHKTNEWVGGETKVLDFIDDIKTSERTWVAEIARIWPAEQMVPNQQIGDQRMVGNQVADHRKVDTEADPRKAEERNRGLLEICYEKRGCSQEVLVVN